MHVPAISVLDLLKSALILVLATVIGFLFYNWGLTEANIITLYILGVHVGFCIHQKFHLQLYCLHCQCADIQFLFYGTEVFSACLRQWIPRDISGYVPCFADYRFVGIEAEVPCQAFCSGCMAHKASV